MTGYKEKAFGPERRVLGALPCDSGSRPIIFRMTGISGRPGGNGLVASANEPGLGGLVEAIEE